jgi:hypothetical protein
MKGVRRIIMSNKITISALIKIKNLMKCKEKHLTRPSIENGYKWDYVDSSYGRVKVWTKK